MADHGPEVRNGGADGPFLFVCEHASNAFPHRWGDLGLGPAERAAHIAWDPGALGVAQALAGALGSPLVAGRVSRLVYDCNRPPDAPGAMAERSEIYEIPGNRALGAAQRLERVEAVYLPFQAAVAAELARRMARGLSTVLVTVHSFTPLWFGRPRALEFGVIHDADPAYARAVAAGAAAAGLRAALNEPYSAADGVVHTLRLHATPHGLPHAMLEIRNDLISDAAAQAGMAARLAPVLTAALESMQPAPLKTGVP